MNAVLLAERRPQKLALIVGSNPLPNYLAAMVLSPKEVVLLHSPETAAPRENLRTALSAKGIEVSSVCIADATDARKIQQECKSLRVDHLHYSGGTKPMAAHARATVKLTESQASYLDERKGLLRFDDGYEIPLSACDLGLTLDVVLQLHGGKRKADSTAAKSSINSVNVEVHAFEILKEPRDGSSEEQSGPSAEGAARSDQRTVSSEERNRSSKEGSDGRWLELWVANRIADCVSDAKPQVRVVVERANPQRDFEIDVALVRGHRLFVVSCTTSKKLKPCKAKLFEVAMRAKQMGGDLARSALVSLIDGPDQNGWPYIEQLRADIASVWGAPNVPRVFGQADLREWAGVGCARNLDQLKEWLDS